MNRPRIVEDSIFWENTTIKRQAYTPEIKERTVRMLIEALSDYPSTWSAIQAIASKIGCTPETLRSWHKKNIEQTTPASLQAQSQEQRIKELERENNWPSASQRNYTQGCWDWSPSGDGPSTQIMFDFIDDHKNNYGTLAICRVLPIAPSNYYGAQNLSDNPHKRSLRSQHDLQGVWRGKSKITTNSRDDQKRADDLVNRNFSARRPNQLWVADFTYIKTTSGWVYTAFIIDVFARAIGGWEVSYRMNTDMVMAAINQAIVDRKKPKNVIHHSDRGVQYLSIRRTLALSLL